MRDALGHDVEVRAVDVNFSEWGCTLEPASEEGTASPLRRAPRLAPDPRRTRKGDREASSPRAAMATPASSGSARSAVSRASPSSGSPRPMRSARSASTGAKREPGATAPARSASTRRSAHCRRLKIALQRRDWPGPRSERPRHRAPRRWQELRARDQSRGTAPGPFQNLPCRMDDESFPRSAGRAPTRTACEHVVERYVTTGLSLKEYFCASSASASRGSAPCATASTVAKICLRTGRSP